MLKMHDGVCAPILREGIVRGELEGIEKSLGSEQLVAIEMLEVRKFCLTAESETTDGQTVTKAACPAGIDFIGNRQLPPVIIHITAEYTADATGIIQGDQRITGRDLLSFVRKFDVPYAGTIAQRKIDHQCLMPLDIVRRPISGPVRGKPFVDRTSSPECSGICVFKRKSVLEPDRTRKSESGCEGPAMRQVEVSRLIDLHMVVPKKERIAGIGQL